MIYTGREAFECLTYNGYRPNLGLGQDFVLSFLQLPVTELILVTDRLLVADEGGRHCKGRIAAEKTNKPAGKEHVLYDYLGESLEFRLDVLECLFDDIPECLVFTDTGIPDFRGISLKEVVKIDYHLKDGDMQPQLLHLIKRHGLTDALTSTLQPNDLIMLSNRQPLVGDVVDKLELVAKDSRGRLVYRHAKGETSFRHDFLLMTYLEVPNILYLYKKTSCVALVNGTNTDSTEAVEALRSEGHEVVLATTDSIPAGVSVVVYVYGERCENTTNTIKKLVSHVNSNRCDGLVVYTAHAKEGPYVPYEDMCELANARGLAIATNEKSLPVRVKNLQHN